MNRIKNFIIIIILIIFLYIIAILPVTCIFKSVTGILCPACGMTRAFWSIMNFNFLQATYFNILSIPLFYPFLFWLCLFYFIIRLIIDLIANTFIFIPNLIAFLGRHYWLFLLLLFISFIFNNLKIYI